MVSSDPRSVGELEGRVDELDSGPATEMDETDRARLIDALVALADAYGNRGAFDSEADAIERLDRLRRSVEDGDVDIHLASALANATEVHGRDDVYETGIDPNRIASYRERIEDLYERRPDPVIAAPLARATAQTINAFGTADLPDRIPPLLDRIETVYDSHPEPDIAASLLRAGAHAELYLDTDPDDGDAGRDRVSRAEELFATHPDGEVAAGLAGILAARTNEDAKRTDVERIEERIGRIEALAQRHPAHEEAIVRWLPVATANATRASFERADVERIEHWARDTVAHHERLSTASSATWVAVATFFSARASFFDGDPDAGEEKLERLEALERRYDDPVFEHWLGRAMFDAARCYVETDRPERARSMAEELSEFAVGHRDREAIESGLEALYSHAPEIFGDLVDDPDERTTDQRVTPETVGGQSSEATTVPLSSDKGSADRRGAANPTETSAADPTGPPATADAPEADDVDDVDDGCCGDGGCESCGTDRELTEPASLPVLVAAGATAVFVGVSVVYTCYRLAKRVGDALAGS